MEYTMPTPGRVFSCNFPKGDFRSDNYTSCNFPNVKFPNQQLAKIMFFESPQARMLPILKMPKGKYKNIRNFIFCLNLYKST